eukprot:TRINITY_DN5195_c0_g1_i1.p1 TRINITY_DN5195_c0_g1~~TRINITY_DN5195_c0_g1_i1.p1  ORF type:complete len:444 (-),score=146.96 TRINITY_DN5195_c0_g1_i1:26-1216(-)
MASFASVAQPLASDNVRRARSFSGASGGAARGSSQKPPAKRSKGSDEDFGVLPALAERFELIDRVGEGTFSSVYSARVKDADDDNQLVAVKRIYPNASPSRVANEVQHLITLRGLHGVCPILHVFRHEDNVALVMPFFDFAPFKSYMYEMDATSVAEYMRALLRAVAHTHAHGIIHRDIKPSNFLRSKDGRRYMLIDFGLAQLEGENTRSRRSPGSRAGVSANLLSPSRRRVLPTQRLRRSTTSNQTQRRMKQTAARAGTRGFRAPEVLFRYDQQTCAIDVWSVGVVLLSILTQRYPFFHSPDDMTGLAELIAVFGFERLRRAASRCQKTLTFAGADESDGHDLRALVRQLCPSMYDVMASEAYDLLAQLLEPYHRERISAADALRHPFLQKFASN